MGIDVGGTFTDLVAVPAGGTRHDLSRVIAHKVPSTPADPARAVITGLRHLLAQGIGGADVVAVTHGTTLGLNAILQRRGARVALLTSRGHRDMLHIGRARLPRSFDLHARPPRAVVPRERVVEIDVRLTPRGGTVHEPTDVGYAEARDRLAALDVQAVAVSLIGGYAGAATERALAERLAADLGVPVTAAAVVWPEAGEYERTTVAVLDAQIRPLMTAYLTTLRDRLADLGLAAPLFISTSNGGSMSLSSALQRPIDTVLSGPAAGVAAASRLWPGVDLVTIDMGGTSSDIGVLRGGRPVLTTTATIGDHPLTMPVVEVSAIGAGGGSVIWADDSGAETALRVGPASVGADPGPAAYGAGGLEPALTDAYVHAGIVDAAAFLGGAMQLDARAAATALARPATAVDVDGTTPALAVVDGAFRTATAGMAARVRTVLARHGEVPERFTFVAFGGAGGTHAAMLADALGVRRVIVPATAGTFCALGAAVTPVRRDFVASVRVPVTPGNERGSSDDHAGTTGAREISRIAADLTAEAVGWLESQGSGRAGEVSVTADARYTGQPTSLTVELTTHDVDGAAAPVDLAAADIRAAFAAAHTRHYGFADDDAVVQIDAVRVAVTGAAQELHPGDAVHRLARRPGRDVWIGRRWIRAEVLEPVLADPAGHPDRTPRARAVSGPAVVEKADTSVLVPPGWTVSVTESGDLHLVRTEQQEVADAVGPR
nr:hydantoinase/oxoprolinase family protein [Nakamurella flavida]